MLISEATKNSLVYDLSWDIDSMMACCGAIVVMRLGASYTSPAWLGRVTNETMAEFSSNNDIGEHLAYCCESIVDAVPLDIAFAGVLSDILDHGPQPALCFASDSLRTTGDVHVGPFSTKNFVNWLWENNLAQIGEIKARHLVGYTFKLNVAIASRALQKYTNQYKRYRKKQLKEHPSWVLGQVDNDWNNWRDYDVL